MERREVEEPSPYAHYASVAQRRVEAGEQAGQPRRDVALRGHRIGADPHPLVGGGMPPDQLTGKGKEFVQKYVEKYKVQPEGYAISGSRLGYSREDRT